MSKKTFNPTDWQPTIQNSTQHVEPSHVAANDDLELIVKRIESSATDIAPNYADWRDLGFALADALGESGRNYYHRLSRFYPSYSQSETDKQYSACLASHGHGVTIKTLYHLAKSSGVDVSVKKQINQKNHINHSSDIGDMEDLDEMQETNLPTFSDEIYTDLPGLLQKVVAKSNSPEDRDLLLLGSLVVISACLPKVYGIYAEREVYPNLFLFVTAQASAGKGRLTLCRKLVDPIHKALREVSRLEFEEYQKTLTEYAAAKNKTDVERPKEPPVKMLVIPANNSATGLFQILNDNNGS